MEQIKEFDIHDQTIDMKLAKGFQINDYQMQLIHKDEKMLCMRRDKRLKNRITFDIRCLCSLEDYLKDTILDEIPFIRLLIAILEDIQHIQKQYYICIKKETVFFSQEGHVKFLVLPLVKNEYDPIDMEIKGFLIDIVKEVQLKEGNEILGILVKHLKSSIFHTTSLLQDLHVHNPAIPKMSLWNKLFHRDDEDETLSYPLPNMQHKAIDVKRDFYVEEIVEEQQQTMMLFEEVKSIAMLQTENKQFEIDKETFTIGRNALNDCYLAIPSVSNKHAVILREQEGYYLKDLHSSNATYINGKKLEPMQKCLLHDRDQVTFANTTFDFHEY